MTECSFVGELSLKRLKIKEYLRFHTMKSIMPVIIHEYYVFVLTYSVSSCNLESKGSNIVLPCMFLNST